LRWDEVTARLDPARFTLKTLPKRFEKMSDPLLDVFAPGVDVVAALRRVESRMKGKSARKKGKS